MPDRQQYNQPRRADDRDPSHNVWMLVQEASRRLDDLRVQEAEHLRELLAKDEKLVQATLKMHTDYGRELADNETKRLDQVIASIISTAADVNTKTVETAATLQATVAQTAEAARIQLASTELALRNQVTTTAEAAARTTIAQNEANAKRFQVLEDAKSETKGKSAMTTTTIALLSGLGVSIVMLGLGGFASVVWYVLSHLVTK